MRARERISCSVGNVFNDLFVQLFFSFEILFFMKVLELSASQAGLMLLIGQVSDASMSLISGYLGDNINVPFLSNKIGRRKSWHLMATVVMAISIPLLFNECFLCNGSDTNRISLVYFGFFSVLVTACFSIVEINHLAFITAVAENVEEFTTLTALRTMFSFLSGVYVYAVAWALLGKDSGDSLGPNNLSDFAYLSWIATGTGVFFATIFYIGKKEPKKSFRKSSTYTDFTPNISGRYMGISRETSLVHTLVNMLVAPSTEKAYQEEGNQELEDQENCQRKKSLLQKFVDVMFYEEEIEQGNNSLTEAKILNTAGESQDEVTKQQMFHDLRQLNRDRKKSLLIGVIDGLLFRPDQSQEELSTENIEDQVVVVDSTHEEYTYENHWSEDELHVEEKETVHSNGKKKVETVKNRHENIELEVDQDNKTTSLSANQRQRRPGVVSMKDDKKLGLSNFGFAFEYEGSEETEKDCSNVSSGFPKPKRSVTFSLSEFHVLPLVDGNEEREFKVDESIEKPTTVPERSQVKRGKGIDSVENDNSPSASEDKHEVLGLTVLPQIHPSKKRRPKSIKNWLRDPSLYKVAIIFTCSRLVYNTVYTYLALFLTERLQFAKEAIAYFPLVLLISASLSSMLCGKLYEKIGAKLSYLLAASLVMGGAVWSYFQTPSTKQTTYAPVVIIGGGMSIMYVMALAFMTELIGENKETSGAVISIITIIARLSSGGLVFGIQEFYPAKGTDSNEAIGSYVQHVFVMAPGILTLVGFLLVLFFQPLLLSSKNKEPKSGIEVQAGKDESPTDDVVSQYSSKCTARPSISSDVNQNSTMDMMDSYSEDTKL